MEVLKRVLLPLLLIHISSLATAQGEQQLLASLSPLVQSIYQEMNAETELQTARNLLAALERDASPAQAERLLSELNRKETFLKSFYEALAARLATNPEVLERVRSSLQNVKSKMRMENIVFPSFSRTWAAFGILLTANDYLFSHFATANAIMPVDTGFYTAFTKIMLSVCMVKLGIAVLADALVLKKSAGQLIREFRERSKGRQLTRELIQMVEARREGNAYVSGQVHAAEGQRAARKSLAENIVELLEIREQNAVQELKSNQLLARLKRYFAERRMQKVLAKVGASLTPVEVKRLNKHLRTVGVSEQFEYDPAILRVQEALIADIKAWEESHPDNNIRDLIAESNSAERLLRQSRIQKLKPHWIAALNYFLIGFSLTIASDAATVGIESLPFDNAISLFFRANREAVGFYAGMVGIIATAVHFLAYPRIRRLEQRPTDPTLMHVKKMDRSAWEFFRRSALLAQLDYEAAKPAAEQSQWSHENSWSFLRTVLKKHDVVPKIDSAAGASCMELQPF